MSEREGYRYRKVAGDGEKSVDLSVKTTAAKKDKLRAFARARGLSMSQFVVEAVNLRAKELGAAENIL